MSPKEIAKRRGPKTPAGKLAVSRNASKHGILSPRPVVTAFESEKAWQAHRQAIIESLAPEGGIEDALAERVALASWRLNRVAIYETECIAQEQERVLEDVRKDREHTLRFASLYDREARDIAAPLMRQGLVESPKGLSDLAIEAVSSPEVALEGAEIVRRYYEVVRAVCEAPEDAAQSVSLSDAGWLLENAVHYAVDIAAAQNEENARADGDHITERSRELEDELFERVGDRDEITTGELRTHVAWVATQAGMHTSSKALLEQLHTIALHELQETEKQREKVERQITEKRRARILPSADELQKIGRYEAHLSREMFRSLHELEALQTRRAGGAAPLGRVDVSS